MDYSKLSTATLQALQNKQPLDYSKLTDEELNELSKVQRKPAVVEDASTPTKTESALRGAAQGASFGFADELTGAIESLLTDKTYEQARDESRANYKSAEEENPLSYLGGSLVGGVAVPVPFGGAKTVGQMAARGLGYGAAAGLGAGEADLTQGEFLDAAKEMGTGAAIGGAATGTLAGIGKLGKIIGGSTAGKAYAEGAKGNKLVGKEARQKLGDELVQFAGEAGESIQKELKDEAANKMALLKQAEEGGQKIDVTDILNSYYPDEVSKLPKSYTSEGDAARKALQEPINRAKGAMPEGTVDDELTKMMGELFPEKMATEAGEAASKIEMTPTEIDSFRRAMGRLGYEKDLKDDQVIALAKRLSGKLGERANDEIDQLGASNAKIQDLMEAQDVFNLGSGLDELGNQTKLTPLLQRLESDALSSDIARSKFDKGVGALKRANEELGTGFEKKATELAERYDLARDINKPVSLTGNPVELAKRISGKVANVTGFAVNKVAGTVPGKVANAIYKAVPETIEAIAMKLEAKGSKYAPIMRNLANEPEPKRKAMMFSLMQQPAFREAIESEDE